ncbi:hypothetical protein ATCC90586_011093 [Pythium insidiosum]|nr:hypothetical protein ATCC90586_011093 [Pythium insidiosum]
MDLLGQLERHRLTTAATRSKLSQILGQIQHKQIEARHLPFISEDDTEWHPPSVSMKKAPTWQVKRIIERALDPQGQALYEVEWENTFEPLEHLPARMVREFEQRARIRTAKAYIETEAAEE